MSSGEEQNSEPEGSQLDVKRVPVALTFHGENGEIVKLALMNLLWNVLTLGFFRFWARTRVRRYFWGHTQLNGEAFEYTGRGIHLFIGFLIVAVGFFVATMIVYGLELYFASGEEDTPGAVAAVIGILNLLYFVGIFVLIGVAIYSARHYRLSHTNWRGIRGAMTGSRFKFSMVLFGLSAAMMFSYGLIYPLMRMVTFGRLMRESSFGDRVFSFKGYASRIYPSFLLLIPAYIMFFVVLIVGMLIQFGGIVTMLGDAFSSEGGSLDEAKFGAAFGVLPVLGIFAWFIISGLLTILPAFAFYRTREYQAFADATKLHGLTFSFKVSTGALVRLFLSNYLIVLLTLGILGPLAQLRVFRFFCENLNIDGEIDLETIRQSALAKPERGEGLAEAFDFGTI